MFQFQERSAMNTCQRKITIYTSEKIYKGYIDITNDSLRTIDVFNSANVYWKDPNEKSFNDAILINNASLSLEGNIKLGDFPKLQIRLSEVLFFHDTLENLGDGMEKRRAAYLHLKTQENMSQVHIVTQTRGNSFFSITGTFHGLFKSKSNHRYIPITQAQVVQIVRGSEKWQKRPIPIEGGFIGISTGHIEACNFSQT
jgi:hypothetical protein